MDSSDLSLVPLSVSDTDIGGEIVFLPSRTYGLIAGETGPLPRLFFFFLLSKLYSQHGTCTQGPESHALRTKPARQPVLWRHF